MANQEPSPDSKMNEPPPPYPGTCAPHSGDALICSSDHPQGLPPPYPGIAGSTTPLPPPYSADQTRANDFGNEQRYAYGGIGIPYEIPQAGTTCVTTTITVPQGDCPRCGLGRMDDRPDIALIICLILMAFLFTPLTLCCIPCAFRRTCSNCGYQAA